MATKTSRQKNANHVFNSNLAELPARAMKEMQPAAQDLFEQARAYARKNPESAALWCFGIGFVLGWKMKMW